MPSTPPLAAISAQLAAAPIVPCDSMAKAPASPASPRCVSGRIRKPRAAPDFSTAPASASERICSSVPASLNTRSQSERDGAADATDPGSVAEDAGVPGDDMEPPLRGGAGESPDPEAKGRPSLLWNQAMDMPRTGLVAPGAGVFRGQVFSRVRAA